MNWLPLLIAEGEGPPDLIKSMGPMILLVPMMLVMFIFMARTNSRQKKEAQALLAGLKKNDKVVTTAGIIGIVVAIKEGEDEVTLRTDESTNSRIRVLRSSIVRVTSEEQQAVENKKP